jgi:hypothetical protein
VNQDTQGCRRLPLPLLLHFLFATSSRKDIAYEFFFGTDFRGSIHPDDYTVQMTTRSRGVVVTYIAWIGFFLAILGLL